MEDRLLAYSRLQVGSQNPIHKKKQTDKILTPNSKLLVAHKKNLLQTALGKKEYSLNKVKKEQVSWGTGSEDADTFFPAGLMSSIPGSDTVVGENQL